MRVKMTVGVPMLVAMRMGMHQIPVVMRVRMHVSVDVRMLVHVLVHVLVRRTVPVVGFRPLCRREVVVVGVFMG
ncbi:MAG: hypothetical protein NVS4B3_18020 [Gemmatimonadaceae bacterium]